MKRLQKLLVLFILIFSFVSGQLYAEVKDNSAKANNISKDNSKADKTVDPKTSAKPGTKPGVKNDLSPDSEQVMSLSAKQEELEKKELEINIAGKSLNPDNSFSPDELRTRALNEFLNKKRWDLLTSLGKEFHNYNSAGRIRILNIFLKSGEKLNLNYKKWPEFINSLDYKSLNRKELFLVFSLLKANKMKETVPFLVQFLKYPQTKIRHTAYEIAALIRDDRVFPQILSLFHSSRAVYRCYALEAFSFFQDDRMYNLVLGALKDVNKTVRLYAIKTLHSYGRKENNYHFIQAVKNDEHHEVRAGAISILKERNLQYAIYAINERVADESQLVRKKAVETINLFSNSRGIWAISKQLPEEKNVHLQMLMVKTIRKLDHVGGSSALAHALINSPDDKVRIEAATTLGIVGDRRKITELVQALGDKNQKVISEAAWSLGKLDANNEFQKLLDVLANPNYDYYTWSAALYALEKIDESRAIIPLFDLTQKHPDIAFRKEIKIVFRRILQSRFKY
jgi:HEAT repeat protein